MVFLIAMVGLYNNNLNMVNGKYTMDNLAVIDKKALSILASEEYVGMLAMIEESAEEINATTQIFQKTQSQFMDNMMTVSHPTPFRNLRQVLAEMKRTRQAMGEAYFGIEKKKIRIKKLQKQLEGYTDPLDREEVELKIKEIEWQIECILENVGGAVRKLANYTKQYNDIRTQLPDLSEETFEAEEERYHIMKAFEQGMNAARSHGGIIDEGNQIYFQQIGINGTVAQIEMSNYLNQEAFMLSPVDHQGRPKPVSTPTHEMQMDFLSRMADKFAGCSRDYASRKGMRIITELALLGDQNEKITKV